MSVKLLFIIPPALSIDELITCGKVKYDSYIPTSIPLGVLSISSYLRNNADVCIRVLDLNVILSNSISDRYYNDVINEAISGEVHNLKPDIVGISALFNSNFSYLNELSKIVREMCPEAIITTGGGLPTNLYRAVLEEAPCIDAVCYAEGEIPMLELVIAIERKQYLNTDPSWITKDKLSTDFIPQAKFIRNLDDIPIFAYDLLKFEEYQKHNRYHGDGDNLVVMSLMTTRGCPFRCTFCASHTVHGRKIRVLSAERVTEDIEYIIKRYDVNTFAIEDDHFLVDKQRALYILKELSNKKINIEFPNGLTVYAIDEEIAEALKTANVKMVTIAVESGSEDVLREIIHKPLKLGMVKKAVSILRSKEIYIRAFFIVGFPGETKEHRQQTVEFIRETGFNWVGIMIATPIAGSDLYKECEENNYLVSKNISDFHFGKGNIKTKDFTPEQIENERYIMNLDLNFINNYDMRHNNYEIALIGFNDVIKRVVNHAIAYYCAANCYEKLGNLEKSEVLRERFKEIIKNDKKWSEYAEQFGLIHGKKTCGGEN